MLPEATAVVMAPKIHRPGEARLQQAGFSGTPRHDIIDLERSRELLQGQPAAGPTSLLAARLDAVLAPHG
jgi:hypothetical protein